MNELEIINIIKRFSLFLSSSDIENEHEMRLKAISLLSNTKHEINTTRNLRHDSYDSFIDDLKYSFDYKFSDITDLIDLTIDEITKNLRPNIIGRLSIIDLLVYNKNNKFRVLKYGKESTFSPSELAGEIAKIYNMDKITKWEVEENIDAQCADYIIDKTIDSIAADLRN